MTERWIRVHPALPVVLFLPVALVCLAWVPLATGFWHAAALGAAGFLLWTLAEYILHRWLFHYEPQTSFGQRLHWLIHGYHHAHPADGDRIVVAPWASVPLTIFLYVAFTAVLGDVGRSLFGGFLLGYVAYDCLHYAIHHHSLRRLPLGRRLKGYHLRHHLRDDASGFGVTSRLWDRVFGTLTR